MKHLFASLTKLCVIFLSGGLLLTACAVFDPRVTQEAIPDLPVLEKPTGIIVEGRVVPKEYANLFFTMSGEVIEILVAEGDQVSKGDVLARLGDRESLEARRAAAHLELLAAQQAYDDLQTNSDLFSKQAWADFQKAKLELNTAQENLSSLDNDDYLETIDDARIEVTDAKEALQEAQETYEKYKDLKEDADDREQAEDELEEAQAKYETAVRKRDRLIINLDLASAAVELASARLQDAQSKYETRADAPDPEDLALAQARLDSAQAQLTAIESEIKKLDLLAPFDGTIVLIDISLGERALPSQTVMMIADLSTWHIETSDLSEFDVVSISPDQNARVVPDALPDLSIKAKIESISQVFSERSGDINYKTRLILTEPEPLLRWGMTVEVYLDEPSP
jgi:multidrug efflux pump subunit AcrA (membrane-fusion protein)